MRIENNSSQIFGEKLINRVKLSKFDGHSYIPSECYFLQLNPKIPEDYQAIENITKSWIGAEYADDIKNMAEIKKDNNSYNYIDIFALTNKYNKDKNLDSNSILGIAQVCKSNYDYSAHLEYLETNPKFLNTQNREYKGVGTGILTSLKKIFNKISLFPADSKYVYDFYVKNGFTGSSKLFWKK